MKGIMTLNAFFLTIFASLSDAIAELQVDPQGYILFCPCMGRFGNQVDHYLGTLGFAKALNRTLVLPPFVEYRQGEARSIQVPFKTYFEVDKLAEFHRVLPMEEFMSTLAPTIWPDEQRVSLCYAHRKGEKVASCNAKEGNPFGPFWDNFGVDFGKSLTYGPLHYDVHRTGVAEEWAEKFSAEEWPVLAFTGAPAAFPVQQENVAIHRYLVWNQDMRRRAEEFIKTKLPSGPFVGMHLRNGVDWKRACEFVSSSPTLFSSAQCVGYRNENGSLTEEMCRPSEEIIVKQLRRAIHQSKAKAVFVASDHDHMVAALGKHFGNTVSFTRLEVSDPHLDLAILARADLFVGNCVSSFSAFVKRERDVNGLNTIFWGFPTEQKTHDSTEL